MCGVKSEVNRLETGLAHALNRRNVRSWLSPVRAGRLGRSGREFKSPTPYHYNLPDDMSDMFDWFAYSEKYGIDVFNAVTNKKVATTSPMGVDWENFQ